MTIAAGLLQVCQSIYRCYKLHITA
jgi:hypothetical protein